MCELAGWKHQIVEGYWVFPKDERDTRKFGKDDQTLWKRRKTSMLQCTFEKRKARSMAEIDTRWR